MGKYVLKNARVLLGGNDLSGASNSLGWEGSTAEVETTGFDSDDWQEFLPGFKSFAAQMGGHVSHGAGEVDPVLLDVWAASDEVLSFSGPGQDGDAAYLTKAVEMSLTPFGGPAGEASAFQASFRNRQERLLRGTILHPSQTARIASGDGVARDLGAVAADKELYVALHVLAVSGTDDPTLTVKVQSDDASGFPTPVDRHTFAAAAAKGAQWASVAGPITDTHYRVSYTISGTNPSFRFAVVTAIA